MGAAVMTPAVRGGSGDSGGVEGEWLGRKIVIVKRVK